MKKLVLSITILFLLFFLTSFTLNTDPFLSETKTLCWEISGNGLKQSSYLFGTYHLLNESYLNKLKSWKNKYKSSKAVIVEMVMDSSKLLSVVNKMISKDTTIQELLSEKEYQMTKEFLKDVSGYNLEDFDGFKPMTITILLTTHTWARLRPGDHNSAHLPMDVYFEQLAKADEKEIKALETMEEQMDLLYGNISLKRQKEMLIDLVKDRRKTEEEILKMDECYRKQDLDCLKDQIFTDGTYNEEELTMMVHHRNKKWIKDIISQIRLKPTFIAVGAGHLPGNEGLIGLLRKEGFTVSPILN